MDPDPADMILYATVVREGGFTAAARALGVTKQRVSQRVAALEAALGVRLFGRTTRSVRPTTAGLAYHGHCVAIEAHIREANEGVRAAQQAPVGRLRISAPTLLGRRMLSPVVLRYLALYPQVAVELSLGDRRVDLLEEAFDLAIRVGPLEDSSLASRRIGHAETAVVASPRLLAGRPALTETSDLTGWPCVVMRDGERWELGGRRHPVRPALVVNDLEMLAQAAVAGLGLARLPLLVCADALADGRLARVPGGSSRVPIHALFPSRAFLPTRVRLFLDLLAAHLAGDAVAQAAGSARGYPVPLEPG